MAGRTAQTDDPADAFAEGIGIIGSATRAAKLFGVSQPTVWRWLKARKWCPAEQVAVVSAATGILKARLRPDLYDSEPAPPSTDRYNGERA